VVNALLQGEEVRGEEDVTKRLGLFVSLLLPLPLPLPLDDVALGNPLTISSHVTSNALTLNPI
jgi:hypothetical protein